MLKAIDSFHHASLDVSDAVPPLGTCLYLVGLACFHRTLSGRWPAPRLWTALAIAVLVTLAALWASGVAVLTAAVLVLLALILWEGRRTRAE